MKNLKIPDRKEWGNPKADSHLDAAYRLYAGKAVGDAIPHFVADPFQQAQALRYATPEVFGYYVFCFAEHLTKSESAGESDMASVFMNLLVEKSEKDPHTLARVYQSLSPSINMIAERQKFYGADQDVYGSFLEKRQAIERNLNKKP